MIIDFSVENFKSYKNSQIFTMRKDSSINATTDPIVGKHVPKEGINRVTAIYGPNASGKTNLLDAIAALTFMILRGDTSILRTYFDNDSQTNFFLSFINNEKKYNYILSVKEGDVIGEKLEIYKTQKPSTLYSYDRNIETIQGIAVKGDEKTALIYNFKNNKKKPLLNYLKNTENNEIKDAYLFFSNKIKLYDATKSAAISFNEKYLSAFDKKAKYLDSIDDLISSADFGIKRIKMQEERDGMTIEQQMIILKALFEVDNLGDKRFTNEQKEKMKKTIESGEKNRFARFVHRNGKSLLGIDIENESDGTVAAGNIFLDMFDVLESGKLYVVDEIDCSLHPMILSQIVKVFNSAETNPNGAQLLFTTHDISLLDSSIHGENLLDRDQIWLTDKKPNGESEAYALSSIDDAPRKEENIYRNYILGRYGATPSISIFHEIQKYWEK